MTLTDIQNQLFRFFFSKDIFSIETDINSIQFDDKIGLTNEEKKQLVSVCLEELKNHEIISKINQDKWIIRKSYLHEPQNVEIYPETAAMVAEFVNSYRKVSGVKGSEVNILQIDNEDIQSVCTIGSMLLSLLSQKEEEDEKDEKSE